MSQQPAPRTAPAPGADAARRSDPVLAVTADARLVDELRRLGAAAGARLQLVADLPDDRLWASAPLVVVGGDLARRAARATSLRPRRAGVLVVAVDLDDADVWQHAVALGAEQVAVLPDARDWLVERFASTVEPVGAAHVLGVVGGCGGGGGSLFAAAVAVCAAQRGTRVLLADLDPAGPGADLTLGVAHLPGLRWPDLASARGRLPGVDVREALPRLDALTVLAWGAAAPVDLPRRAVDAVLSAAARTHDLVVLDLPRAADAAWAGEGPGPAEVLVVLPTRLRAVAAAGAMLARGGPAPVPVRAVVRRGQHDDLTARAAADALALPLAAQMRDDHRLDAELARGGLPATRARSPLRAAALQWLDERDLLAAVAC